MIEPGEEQIVLNPERANDIEPGEGQITLNPEQGK
jgi:hypothetical protein